MSGYKILYKVTGSIAAYKSAIIISRLVQAGCDVKVVATESALKFVGKATYEGLSGNQVYSNSFADGEMMSHIKLVKWADLTIVAPATANTINKLACGIGDSLLTSLFLAHDWSKPYLIAPAMNTNMFTHPATLAAIDKLKTWGATILPTEVGYLACGDIGEGKFLDAEFVFEKIMNTVKSSSKMIEKKNVLITYGGTSESIDGVRTITNMSTGKTGSAIAEQLTISGHKVTLLRSNNSNNPRFVLRESKYFSFSEYEAEFSRLLAEVNFDAVVHLAALSDYSPSEIDDGNSIQSLPLQLKMKSQNEEIKITLKKNPKLLGKIKTVSKNKTVKVIGFKLTNSIDPNENREAVVKLFTESNCDFVVHNDLATRKKNGDQEYYTVYDSDMNSKQCTTAKELAYEIEKIIENLK